MAKHLWASSYGKLPESPGPGASRGCSGTEGAVAVREAGLAGQAWGTERTPSSWGRGEALGWESSPGPLLPPQASAMLPIVPGSWADTRRSAGPLPGCLASIDPAPRQTSQTRSPRRQTVLISLWRLHASTVGGSLRDRGGRGSG